MVNPILLIAIPLAVAFILPLLDKLGRGVTQFFHFATLLVMALIALSWLGHLQSGAEAQLITTGGWAAPIGITLRVDYEEIIFINLALWTAMGSLFYLKARHQLPSVRGHIIQILLVVGAVGLIMTRDLFNLFVFLEITSIATFALVLMGDERPALEASFKYMVLGALASTFLLLGVALIYKATHTLYLDDVPSLLPSGGPLAKGLAVALGLILVAMVAELKIFPLNGPGIDLYEAAEPGVMALLVGTAVNAMIFAAWKLVQLFPMGTMWLNAIATLGLITFVSANFIAARQTNVRRMLGYSSSAQLGLIFALMPFARVDNVHLWAVGLLVINHTFAKVALLWLAGLHGGADLKDWRGAFAQQPLLKIIFAIALLSITGLPPFAGFFGKWVALQGLSTHNNLAWVAPILIGAFFELVYYLRWYRASAAGEDREDEAPSALAAPRPWSEIIPPGVFAILSLGLGLYLLRHVAGASSFSVSLLLGAGLLLVFIGALFERETLGFMTLFFVLIGGYLYFRGHAPALYTLRGLFSLLVFGGAGVVALASLSMEATPRFYGLFLALLGAVVMLLEARDLLVVFVAWEMMTWLSYMIIGGQRSGYRYMLFSGAAGFLLLGAFMVALSRGVGDIAHLSALTGAAEALTWGLMIGAMLLKAAAFGVHIYAPDAYTEAPDAFTPFLSGVISKLPIFMLILALTALAAPSLGPQIAITPLIAWLAGITAFAMTLMAALQEDAKRLLAYSSIGQVAYIIMGLALLSPLGWTAALYHTVHHFAFKMLLFLAIAGVILRVGTRQMYQMGGLIKVMPFSFISVLIGIIAVSGVTPLGGFTGKWLLYHALLEKGWYGLLAFTMFASLIAFLYLYRLIHSVFLGQLKTRHRHVREAPLPLLIAQGVLMIGLLVLGAWPQAILRPIQHLVGGLLGRDIDLIDGLQLTVAAGSYNPVYTMILVMIVFLAALGLLYLAWPRVQKVGQLDIVYAGEIPPPPEEIHFAYDFNRIYERAFAPLLRDWPTRLWAQLEQGTQALISVAARFYTGNAQTYALYSVLLLLILLSVMGRP
ncbi:hypothetical protein KKB55_02660 [Myxococcota bacterium]|nr:hypothetical protein [Myxococcota bacterium]